MIRVSGEQRMVLWSARIKTSLGVEMAFVFVDWIQLAMLLARGVSYDTDEAASPRRRLEKHRFGDQKTVVALFGTAASIV